MRVHQPQPLVVNVQQAAAQFRPVLARHKTGRVIDGFLNREMLFESDFSLHVLLLVDSCPGLERGLNARNYSGLMPRRSITAFHFF